MVKEVLYSSRNFNDAQRVFNVRLFFCQGTVEGYLMVKLNALQLTWDMETLAPPPGASTTASGNSNENRKEEKFNTQGASLNPSQLFLRDHRTCSVIQYS